MLPPNGGSDRRPEIVRNNAEAMADLASWPSCHSAIRGTPERSASGTKETWLWRGWALRNVS